MRTNLALKRVYESPSTEDGLRILVDRLWPRGLSKEKAQVDLWMKEVAPSTELRVWFGHDPAKWEEFKARYRQELDHNQVVVSALKQAITEKPATLLYGTKGQELTHALILREYLQK